MPNTTYSLEEMTQILDHSIEDRAEWFWRLYTAFKAVNPEKAREACEKVILEFGQRKGRKMNLPADANAQQFIEGVANGPAFYSFGMVYDKLSPDDSGLKFYKCPFLEVFETAVILAWQVSSRIFRWNSLNISAGVTAVVICV